MPRSGSKKSGFLNIPARLLLKERDNATGSYPSILRLGDKDRKGSYNLQFDDTYTINFGRRIQDKFELKDSDKVDGVLGYTKVINQKLWSHTANLEIRKESFVSTDGSTAADGALVFVGAGDSEGRWIRTREKIKNPVITAEVIYGPYNETRSVLREGLGLKSPGTTDSRGLKVQVSSLGTAGTWTTVKTLTGDLSTLISVSSTVSRSDFDSDNNSRKRVKIKLTPQDFSSMGSKDFYLRFIQESVSSPSQAEWALGYINIDYHDEQIRYPLQIDASSRVGQKIATGAIANTHTLPTLSGHGRSVSGISDVHLNFTPGEDISPFEDSRINTVAEDLFFRQGSDPSIVPNMSSPLWSKTQIVIDLSSSQESTFGMTTKTTTSDPALETDDKIKQHLMVYWNKDLKRWEKIAQGISGNPVGSSATNSLENMIASGALGFSSIDMVSTGSTAAYSNQRVVNSELLSSYVRPTTVFGFPFEGKYAATSSQYITARDLGIVKPFILEKCQITFDSKFDFSGYKQSGTGNSHRTYSLRYGLNNLSNQPALLQRVWIPTFFILKQQDFDFFTKEIKYETDYNGSFTESRRSTTTPGVFKLSTDNEIETRVESSRELITYGQITLFTSSSSGTQNFDIREVLDKGLSRDAEVDILKFSGQTSFSSETVDVKDITGSFTINFPARVSSVIEGGARTVVKSSTSNTSGLWLDNKIGGRSYGNLDGSCRSLANGTPTNQTNNSYLVFPTTTGTSELSLNYSDVQSTDLYSPYIILPEDKLIFGWQYPVPYDILRNTPGSLTEKFNSMTLFGNSKLTFFGSQLKDSAEYHETVNQNLISDSIHEIIGSDAVVDQFELSRTVENYGNYLDDFVNTNDTNPIRRVGVDVKSRITTPKGLSTYATTFINFSNQASFIKGINDGDRIAIQDSSGDIGHFYGYRTSPDSPRKTDTTLPSSRDTGVDGVTDRSITSPRVWADVGYFYFDLKDSVDLGGGSVPTTGLSWSASGNKNDYPSTEETYSVGSSLAIGTPSFIYSYNIWGGSLGGLFFSATDKVLALASLGLAINASGLKITAQLTYTTDWALRLTQNVSGTIGNKPVKVTKAKSLYSDLQVDYAGLQAQNFSGGSDLIDGTKASFTRISPTEDGLRIYSDSKLKSSDIGFINSNFGTMQTEGSPIRPKYYLSTKRHGLRVDMLDQARDSKSVQPLLLLDQFTGGALESPVKIVFVSGSTSDTFSSLTYVESTPVDAVNKTINSVLTGAFYDKP